MHHSGIISSLIVVHQWPKVILLACRGCSGAAAAAVPLKGCALVQTWRQCAIGLARWLLASKHAAQQRQQDAEHEAALVCHILEAHFHQTWRDWHHAAQGGQLAVMFYAC